MLLERIISCKHEVLAEYRHISTVWTVSSLLGGLNAFYWYQIFALDSAVVEVREMSSSHGGHLTNAMYHHGKHSNQINTP